MFLADASVSSLVNGTFEDLVKMSLMSHCQAGGIQVSWTVGFVIVSCKVLFSPWTLNHSDASSSPRDRIKRATHRQRLP